MITALDGTLQRRSNGWFWRDGTSEPRVRDLTPASRHAFRCRNTGGPEDTYIEVPRSAAALHPELAWVLEGEAAGHMKAAIRGGGSDARGRDGTVLLVPLAQWEAWSRSAVLDAAWDEADEEAILDRARELGWSGRRQDGGGAGERGGSGGRSAPSCA